MRDHSGHLIADVAALQVPQTTSMFSRFDFHTTLLLKCFGKLSRTTTHQNLQKSAIEHKRQQDRSDGPESNRVACVKRLEAEVSQIAVGTGFQVPEKLIDVGVRDVGEPLVRCVGFL